MRFAQAAQVILQLLLEQVGPPLAEAWFSRVEAQEQRYSWRTLAADQELDHRTVWYYVNYVGSASLALKQYSPLVDHWVKEGVLTNQLWTGTWRILAQLRKALQLCYALSQQQLPGGGISPGNLTLSLQQLLAHHQQALKNLARMIERSSAATQGLSHWAPLLTDREEGQTQTSFRQELLACTSTHEVLEIHGYGPAAVHSLGKLVALLP